VTLENRVDAIRPAGLSRGMNMLLDVPLRHVQSRLSLTAACR
jgi:hypothetical protein